MSGKIHLYILAATSLALTIFAFPASAADQYTTYAFWRLLRMDVCAWFWQHHANIDNWQSGANDEEVLIGSGFDSEVAQVPGQMIVYGIEDRLSYYNTCGAVFVPYARSIGELHNPTKDEYALFGDAVFDAVTNTLAANRVFYNYAEYTLDMVNAKPLPSSAELNKEIDEDTEKFVSVVTARLAELGYNISIAAVIEQLQFIPPARQPSERPPSSWLNGDREGVLWDHRWVIDRDMARWDAYVEGINKQP